VRVELHPSVISPVVIKPSPRILATADQCRIVRHPLETWATKTPMSTKLTVSKFLTFTVRPTQSIARLVCNSKDQKTIALRKTTFQIINDPKRADYQRRLPKILKFFSNLKQQSASRKEIVVRVRTSPESRHEKLLSKAGEF